MSPVATGYYRQQGLTLIELLVTLIVLAIIVTQAAPAFHQFYMKQLLRSQTNQLFSSLMYARSEAIKQGRAITLCAGQKNRQCATTQANWSQGWLLFIDLNNNQQHDINEPLLQAIQLSKESITLAWNRKRSIRFDNRGHSAGYNGSFTFCAGAIEPISRKIILSNTGRARIDTASESDPCTLLGLAAK